MHVACNWNNDEIVRQIYEFGGRETNEGQLNFEGETPLELAISENHIDCASYLRKQLGIQEPSYFCIVF